MNDKVIGNRALSHFDALVIGSGAGGGAVAALLCTHGLNVLVLEAGPNHFSGLDAPGTPSTHFSNDELKLEHRSFISPDSSVEPRTFRGSEADGPRKLIGDVNTLPKTVGGAAVHADVKTPRFQPFDFQLGTDLGDMPGASFADWPLDYDALEPFYAYAEKAVGVQGLAGADPFAAKRSGPYPMPPGVPMYGAVKFAEAVAKVGYTVFPYPTAVNSKPYDGRPACVDCGFCSSYGCPSHAKGSPAVTTLRKALLTGRCQLWPETRVVRLRVDGAKTSITGVDALGPEGEALSFQADRYVLAASPIEDARLLFLSDPDGLGNSSGLVGRNLMFHCQTIALGVFAERLHLHRGRTVAHALTAFRGAPKDPAHPLGGIIEIGAARGPLSEALIYATDLGKYGALLKKLIRQSPLRDRTLVLTMQGEDAPQPTNRVDLDPDVVDLDGLRVARVTYRHHRLELDSRDFYSPKMLDLLMATGAEYAFIAPIDDPPDSKHVLGTLRFGTDPRASVCDPTGRFHDIGNLYAADGSLFPTSSGYNPYLTIVTVATRVAAEMVSPGSPERALS